MEDDEERTTLELPAAEPCELDEYDRMEILLLWAPVVGEA
jgi:hypothetical protein